MNDKSTILVKSEETIVRKRHTVLRVESEHMEPYRNIRKYTRTLSPGSVVDIMMFLITRMAGDNTVNVGENLFKEYIKGLPEPITMRTFHRAIRRLTDENILSSNSRGEYTINPDVLWNGELGTRVTAIRFNEQPIKKKENEEVIMDRRENYSGEVIVSGDEQKAKELEKAWSGTPLDNPATNPVIEVTTAVKKAVTALTGGEERKFPMQEVEEKLNTDGNKQGQWDAPLEYPQPKTGFNA